jgi:uncharacterized protein
MISSSASPGDRGSPASIGGKDEVRRHFREIAELSRETFRTELHDVIAGEDHAIGLVGARAERDGKVVDLPRVHVWHVREGQLNELWIHPDDQYAFDAYWDLNREPPRCDACGSIGAQAEHAPVQQEHV